MFNETAAQSFVCCHLTDLNAPGWDDIMLQLTQYFLKGTSFFTNEVVDQLYNMQNLRTIEVESIETRVCIDDKRIHKAESDILRAKLLGQIMGEILHMYTYISARAIALRACMLSPTVTTGCVTNTGPTLGVDIIPNMLFVQKDLFFQSICGKDVIEQFEIYRLTKVTC